MKLLKAAAPPQYIETDPSDVMTYWMKDRPDKRNAEPTAQGAVIESLYSSVDKDKLRHCTLFKGVSPADFKAALALATRTGQSGPGYYSSDVCRSLTFIRGFNKPVNLGDRGYLLAVQNGFGESPIPDDAGMVRPDGQRAFNNDHLYAGAHVLAYMVVKITKLGRR